MNNEFVVPGPETVIWWGVHVPVLAAVFGIAGILLGHLMAPVSVPPLSMQRQAGLIIAGILVSLGITIATGQRPLVVLAWSIGLGFSGMTSVQASGRRASAAVGKISAQIVEEVADRLRGTKDDGAGK